MTWSIYSIIATLCYIGVSLLIKKLTTEVLEAEILNFYYFLSTSVFFLMFALIRGTSLAISASSYSLFFWLGILAVAVNIFYVKAMAIAPNPAYTESIFSVSTIIIAISSFFLFGSELEFTKIVGIILTIIGVIFVVL